MEQQFNQHQRQNILQEQKLSFRQQQSLNLLHLPAIELQSAIDAELAQNPVLESDPDLDNPPPELSDDPDQWLEQLLAMSEENRFIRAGNPQISPEEEERRQHFLDSVTEEVSFPQFLMNQIRFLGLNEEMKNACDAVIGALDEEGYLTIHPADLAMSSSLPMSVIEQSIDLVRQLDPPGVAAADLKQRLLIQLERKGVAPDDPATRAVRECLEDIGANRLPQVAKKLGIEMETLRAAIVEIQKLNPRLEVETGVSPHEYIAEEVVVSENPEGSFEIKVLNDALPGIYISPHYRNMLKDPALPKEARNYITEKLKSGINLINSILQRQSTLKRVSVALVSAQADFFHKGDAFLKPLTMSQIADVCKLHETTVSRTVSGKFLRCKFGLYPLRHFFSSSGITQDRRMESESEVVKNEVSGEVVKQAISRLIASESPETPLSDAKLTLLLETEGFHIARRTLAKYREQLRILPSNLRKQH